MDNLQTAKNAVEAELLAAQQGLAYYQSRVTQLEQTLAAVAGAIAPRETTSSAKEKAVKPSSAPAIKSKKQGKKVGTSKGGTQHELPSTGGDYWVNLISDQPQSVQEIMNSVIGGLSFTPTKDQVKKLTGRMTFALNSLVKTKKIKDSGAGRDRRFFK